MYNLGKRIRFCHKTFQRNVNVSPYIIFCDFFVVVDTFIILMECNFLLNVVSHSARQGCVRNANLTLDAEKCPLILEQLFKVSHFL